MGKIIGLGNALVDVLVMLEDDNLLKEMQLPKGSMQLIDKNKYDEINSKFSKMDTFFATGGSAANAIMALSCLGAQPGFIGKVSDDRFGKFFAENLKSHNIESKLIVSKQESSGVASTFISPDGERTFGTYLGAAALLEAQEITPELFKGYSYLFIEGYLVQDHEMIHKAVSTAKQCGLHICLDLASYNIVADDLPFFQMLVRDYVDIVFANEEEAKAYTSLEPREALEVIGNECSVAIVKIGSKGSYIKKGTEVLHVDAYLTKNVIDTTGAGDYFAAGFMYGLTSGFSLEKCAKIGSLLSSSVIQNVGTTLQQEVWAEIKLNIQRILQE